MRDEAVAMHNTARDLAASGNWPRAFLELWRAFDRFSLVLLEERFHVGASGTEIDRFALRRAVAVLLPDYVKRRTLAVDVSQARGYGVSQELEARFIDILDSLFAAHNSANLDTCRSRGREDNYYKLAFEALTPLVDYLSEATELSTNEAGGI